MSIICNQYFRFIKTQASFCDSKSELGNQLLCDVINKPTELVVDEKNNLVYFMSTKNSVLRSNMYCLDYTLPQPRVVMVTCDEGYSHKVVVGRNFEYAVVIQENQSEVQAKLAKLEKSKLTILANLMHKVQVDFNIKIYFYLLINIKIYYFNFFIDIKVAGSSC